MFIQHRQFKQGEFFLVFVDTSGEGSDYNAGHFLSHKTLDIPMTLHYEGSITEVTPALKVELERIHDETGVPPVVCYETNNGGGYELERLSRLNRNQKFEIYYQYKLNAEGELERTDKMGWNTNSSTRPAMLNDGKELVNNRLVRIYYKPTVEEMFDFVRKQSGNKWKVEAETGAHDDLLMSLFGVWQMYQTEQPPAKKSFNETSGNASSLFY